MSRLALGLRFDGGGRRSVMVVAFAVASRFQFGLLCLVVAFRLHAIEISGWF